MDEQNRNLLLAVMLSVGLLLGWEVFFNGPQREAARQAQLEQQQAAEQAREQGIDAETAALGAARPAGVPGAGVGAGDAAGGDAAQPAEPAPRLTFETEAMRGSVNLRGARIDDVILTRYTETLNGEELIHLFQPRESAAPYFADYGWLSSDPNIAVPDATSIWSVAEQSGNRITLTYDNESGQQFQLTYDFDAGEYLVAVEQSVINGGDATVNFTPYGRILRFGEPETQGFFILHEGPIGYFEQEALEEWKYKRIREETKAYTSTGGWLGFSDKYWLGALLPNQTNEIEATLNSGRSGNTEFFQALVKDQPQVVAPGSTSTLQGHLFVGAKKMAVLDRYTEELNVSNFWRAIDFGWFWFFTKPFAMVLNFFHGILGNFGLAILGITLLVKLALFPLANASYRSMSKMKLLSPKMQELREKHGDDRQAMQQDMMKLYKEEKVNPLGGCLPILVQIPIFFALYKVLFISLEMRHAPFFGWIQDLSAPDPTSIMNLFGLLPWGPDPIPLLGFFAIGIWPLLMGLSMFVQQKLNPPPPDPMQARIMMLLPIVFTFILAPFPAGLVIYWTWNNLLSVAQQWFIMKNTKLEKVKVKDPKAKKAKKKAAEG